MKPQNPVETHTEMKRTWDSTDCVTQDKTQGPAAERRQSYPVHHPSIQYKDASKGMKKIDLFNGKIDQKQTKNKH